MSGFEMKRLGMLMEPDPGNPQEIEGVLNPAAARGPDGELYLFPRLVARGNYSRIGIARVRFNEAGDPVGVERLGIALEPEADYERRPDGSGGCEDPRITFVEPLQRYVMTYTAFSPRGPRIARAISQDLFQWKRLGLSTFAPYHGIDSSDVDDKDACVFPVAIPNPSGEPELAVLHRPLFPGTRPEETASDAASREVDLDRESIWISYRPLSLEVRGPENVSQFSHHRLATPVSPWERLKIGCGTPSRPDPARLADRLSWCQRNGRTRQRHPSAVLLGRSDGAFESASASDPLSFGRAGVDSRAASGTPRDRRECRVPDRH
jgi:beta-1,2-mannobiose phosphorylase / 1,2-beta-oligomannan phosphorylase